jgi:mitochondrial splicing suppressor protein 51
MEVGEPGASDSVECEKNLKDARRARMLGRCSATYRGSGSQQHELSGTMSSRRRLRSHDDLYRHEGADRKGSRSSITLDIPPTGTLPPAMEGLFTCLRCTRALSSGGRQRTAARLVQQAPVRRSFTSSSSLKRAPTDQWRTEGIHSPKRSARPASTAAAPASQEDTFDRQPAQPSDYGRYRAPITLGPNDLFHPLSESPIPAMRQRARFMKQHALCPHPAHQQTRIPTSPRDPEARKIEGVSNEPPTHVSFECPDCGIATYCSEEHWADDFEAHLEICDTLRQINEDDHDLRSGRWFPEFEYPGPQIDEALVNMTNWDTFLYTRQFEAINDDRNMRQVTKLLTYPVTLGSVLHELSPYTIRDGGLTPEGLKSLSGEFMKAA